MRGKGIIRVLFNGRVKGSIALPSLKVEYINENGGVKYKLSSGNTISNKAYSNIDIIKIVNITIE